jgi:uncharacterized protein YdhG (YjbR/CyaY superfamily)
MVEDNARSQEVDAYIAAQPAETRRALSELRACIWQAVPEVTELMNDKMPAFALIAGGKRDQQVLIAGYSKYVGFYPGPAAIAAFSDRLAGYKYAKGSIQFPLHEPIPTELVIDMVRYGLSRLLEGSNIV